MMMATSYCSTMVANHSPGNRAAFRMAVPDEMARSRSNNGSFNHTLRKDRRSRVNRNHHTGRDQGERFHKNSFSLVAHKPNAP
jgi:hypothetical protein